MADQFFANGSTISFSSGFSAIVQQIGSSSRSVERADVTPLSQDDDSDKKYLYSKRRDHEPTSVQFYFDPASTNVMPSLGVTQTVTITWPDGSQYIGQGALMSDGTPQLVSDEVMMATRSFGWIGGTGSGKPTLIST